MCRRSRKNTSIPIATFWLRWPIRARPPSRLPAVPRSRENNEPGAIFSVGHSTHPLERFLELLSEHRIEALADVRSFPSSRRWPHFNQLNLRESIERAG